MNMPSVLNSFVARLFLIISLATLLVSCGGGGGSNSSNSSTTGSTQFYATNNDQVNYERVDIEDNSGNIQSSTPIYCPAQSGCSFKANMPAAGSLLFYDKNNTMVNAYILTYPPSDIQGISTSTKMLGIYLFSVYDNETYEDLAIDYNQLANFFANYISTDPNLNTDYLSLLGKYYQRQTIGTGLSYADFDTNLRKSLSSSSVFPANQLASYQTDYLKQFLAFFKAIPLLKSAYAGDPSLDNVKWSPCSTIFTTSVPRQFGPLLKVLEVGAKSTFVTGAIVDGLGSVYGDACKGQDPNMKALKEQMSQLLAAMEKLAGELKLSTQFFADTALVSQLETMDKNRRYIEDTMTAYQSIKDISPNGNLSQWINDQGGLEKAWNNSANVKKIFDLPAIWNAAQDVIRVDRGLFNKGLALKCGLRDAADFDLAAARAQCNAWIRRYQLTVANAGYGAQVLLNDVTTTIALFSGAEPEFIGRNIVPPGAMMPDVLANGSKDWRNYFTNKLETPLKQGMESALTGFAEKIETVSDGGPIFDVYGDISTDLRTSLINAGCVNPDNSALNIQRWIRNGSDSYVNVGCKKDGTYYNSKYLYKRDGNNVRNVLGVIVSQNLIGSTRDIEQAAFYTKLPLSGLKLIIDKSQNLFYADHNGNSLPLSYGNDDIATVDFRKIPNGSGTLFFSFTDRTPQKNSWIFRLNQPQGRDNEAIILDCYITDACGLGSTNNAIGFGAWDGPDPVIVNIQPNPKGSFGDNRYYNFTIKLPTDDPKITTKLANY